MELISNPFKPGWIIRRVPAKPKVTQKIFKKDIFSFKIIEEKKTTIIGAIKYKHNAFTNGIYLIDKKKKEVPPNINSPRKICWFVL